MSGTRTDCDHCGIAFEAAASMKGGIANCPECGRACSVPGGPEVIFWFALSLGVMFGGGATWLMWVSVGATAGLITAACVAIGIVIAVLAS